MHRLLIASSLCFFTIGCAGDPPSQQERIQQVKDNTDLDDASRLEQYAQIVFEDSRATVSAKSNLNNVTISFRGLDESRNADVATGVEMEVLAEVTRMAQLQELTKRLDAFLPLAEDCQVGDIDVTLETPTYSSPEAAQWVKTYHVVLKPKKFAAYKQTASMDLEKRQRTLPRVWQVKFNGFDQFSYQRSGG